MQSKSFPFVHQLRYKLILCFGTALFFYLFMLFFLPFGVSNYNPNHEYSSSFLIEMLKFTVLLCLILALNEFLFKPLVANNHGLKTFLLWTLWSFFSASSALFLLYNYLGDWHDFRWKSYGEFLINVSVVLIFPWMAVFFIFSQRQVRQRYQRDLAKISRTPEKEALLEFKGQGAKDHLLLSASSFLYAQSQDNYLELFYLKETALKSHLLRATLTETVKNLKHPSLMRCHRSYLVNLDQVIAAEHIYKDMQLKLRVSDKSIPVSQSYKSAILEELKLRSIL